MAVQDAQAWMWEGKIHLVPGAQPVAWPISVPNSCLLTEDRAGPLLMLQRVADITPGWC